MAIDTSSFFKGLFDNSRGLAMLIMDEDGIIIRVNSTFTDTFGYKEADVINKNFKILFIASDRIKQLPENEIVRVKAKGYASNNNYILHQSGKQIWVNGVTLAGTGNKRFELTEKEFNLRSIFYQPSANIPGLLNKYFLQKIPGKRGAYSNIYDTISKAKGNISVSELCHQHYITERQLERMFTAGTGITVKAMCNQVRLVHTIQAIKCKTNDKNLLDIALTYGYYDTAHLSNSIKKCTGYTPLYFAR